jgi:hypothetical protein
MQQTLVLALGAWLIAGCSISAPAARVAAGATVTTSPDDITAVIITLGPEETVFDWTTDRCESLDVPDVVARAVRRRGEIVLVSGNAPRNYFLYGPDFDRLQRSCTPVLTSPDDWDADSFRNQWWIMSVYSDDGDTIHALVHNEYHDPLSTNCWPANTQPSNPCWYNAIAYAVSPDGGRSFRTPPSPAHLVAPPPHKWDPTVGDQRGGRLLAPPPYGYFEPSNIIRGPDAAFYSVFFAIVQPGTQTERGTCVMRTADLTAPSSWRLWDGYGFSIVPSNPYTGLGAPACAFLSPRELDGLRGSLTYNTYLGRYMLVGTGVASDANGARVCGMFYSLSADLITWSRRQLLKAGPLPWCKAGYDYDGDMYPSIIDHADTSVSFEHAGRTPHLYFTRINEGLDRDLLRISLTITKISRLPHAITPD